MRGSSSSAGAFRNALETQRLMLGEWPEDLSIAGASLQADQFALAAQSVHPYLLHQARRWDSPTRAEALTSGSCPLADTQAGTRQTIIFDDNLTAAQLYGQGDHTLRLLQKELGVEANARGNEVRLSGSEEGVELARRVLEQLYGVLRTGRSINAQDVRAAIGMVTAKPDVDLSEVYEDVLAGVGSRRIVRAKNLSQQSYIKMLRSHDVGFAVGPAGTGKTYLAMAMAIAALNRKEVSRVILTRPAVEAGERLGFLPGDLAEKVNPYMRPSLRCTPRHVALREGRAFVGAGRDRGGSPRVHARSYPQRLLRHSRRGPEYDQ